MMFFRFSKKDWLVFGIAFLSSTLVAFFLTTFLSDSGRVYLLNNQINDLHQTIERLKKEKAIATQKQSALSSLVPILVANVPIIRGNEIRPEDVKWVGWSIPSIQGHFLKNHKAPSFGTEKWIAARTISQGEPLIEDPNNYPNIVLKNKSDSLESLLIPGMSAFTINLSNPSGTLIRPGDSVNILYVSNKRGADHKPQIKTLVCDALVMAVNGRLDYEDKKDGGPEPIRTVTLQVTLSDASILSMAQQQGQLSLVIYTKPAGNKPSCVAEPFNDPIPEPTPEPIKPVEKKKFTIIKG